MISASERKVGKDTFVDILVDVDTDGNVGSDGTVLNAQWDNLSSVDNPYSYTLIHAECVFNEPDNATAVANSAAWRAWFGVGMQEYDKVGNSVQNIVSENCIMTAQVNKQTTGSQESMQHLFVDDARISDVPIVCPTVYFGFYMSTTSGRPMNCKGRYRFKKTKMTEANYLRAYVGSC